MISPRLALYLICSTVLVALGGYLGWRLKPMPAAPAPIVSVCPAQPEVKVVDKVLTVTRTVTVPGKPVTVIVTKTEEKDNEKDTPTGPPQAPVVITASPAAQAPLANQPEWIAKALVGGVFNNGAHLVYGVGVEHRFGPLWLGGELTTDAKSQVVLLGTVGVQF